MDIKKLEDLKLIKKALICLIDTSSSANTRAVELLNSAASELNILELEQSNNSYVEGQIDDLSKINCLIEEIASKILSTALETYDMMEDIYYSHSFSFEEIVMDYEMSFSEDTYIQIKNHLLSKEEIKEVQISSEGFEIVLNDDYLKSISEEAEEEWRVVSEGL